MGLAEDVAQIAQQEKSLVLDAFDAETAWRLGLIVRELATARSHSVVADIRRFGQPHQQLFYMALAGTTPHNARWVERKSNIVARLHRSSYAIGLKLQSEGVSLSSKYALSESEYAIHGGSFPLCVVQAGIIGSLTISGLPQRADHELAVEALCLLTGRSYDHLRLCS